MSRHAPSRRAALLALAGLVLHATRADAARDSNPAAPSIVPRAAWGAQPPDASLMQPLTPREIIIHHTAEKQRPDLTLSDKLQRLQRFSRTEGLVGTKPKPAWGDVPYHFYIDAQGRIGEGRSLAFAGDSNTSYNTSHGIQIVVEGHFDQEQPSATQLATLDRLVLWLAARYGIPTANIVGRGDRVAGTECPGRGLKSHLPALRAKAGDAEASRTRSPR